jgi:hypothetical protein
MADGVNFFKKLCYDNTLTIVGQIALHDQGWAKKIPACLTKHLFYVLNTKQSKKSI